MQRGHETLNPLAGATVPISQQHGNHVRLSEVELQSMDDAALEARMKLYAKASVDALKQNDTKFMKVMKKKISMAKLMVFILGLSPAYPALATWVVETSCSNPLDTLKMCGALAGAGVILAMIRVCIISKVGKGLTVPEEVREFIKWPQPGGSMIKVYIEPYEGNRAEMANWKAFRLYQQHLSNTGRLKAGSAKVKKPLKGDKPSEEDHQNNVARARARINSLAKCARYALHFLLLLNMGITALSALIKKECKSEEDKLFMWTCTAGHALYCGYTICFSLIIECRSRSKTGFSKSKEIVHRATVVQADQFRQPSGQVNVQMRIRG